MKNIFLLLLLTLLVAFTFASPEAEAEPAPADYGPNKLGADVRRSLFTHIFKRTLANHTAVGEASLRNARSQRPESYRALLQTCREYRWPGAYKLPSRLIRGHVRLLTKGSQYVPGTRGSAGMRYGSAVVSINANCNPGQWLPWVSSLTCLDVI